MVAPAAAVVPVDSPHSTVTGEVAAVEVEEEEAEGDLHQQQAPAPQVVTPLKVRKTNKRFKVSGSKTSGNSFKLQTDRFLFTSQSFAYVAFLKVATKVATKIATNQLLPLQVDVTKNKLNLS